MKEDSCWWPSIEDGCLASELLIGFRLSGRGIEYRNEKEERKKQG